MIDLFGAVLLFFFGLAPLLSKNGSMTLSTGSSDYLRRKARKYEMLSRLGVSLVFMGFLIQLLGNHIKWSADIDTLNLLLLACLTVLLSVALRLYLKYKKRRYALSARYIPQFDEHKPSHLAQQLWSFTVINNSKQLIKSAVLHLSVKPSAITILIEGEEPTSQAVSRKVNLSDIDSNTSVTIHAWNIGGHITAGLDCYLEVEGKVIRPRVLGFDDGEDE